MSDSALATAAEALAAIQAAMPGLIESCSVALASDTLPLMGLAPLHRPVRLLGPEEAGELSDWFFIGDIHGDFHALHACLQEAERLAPGRARILFLGDIIDRGLHPTECLFLLLDWALAHPGRLTWLAGNHDVAIYRGADGTFASEVIPAEFLSVLNGEDVHGIPGTRLGEFFMALTSRLPRALLFPDGLLATHGGVPLRDRYDQAAALDTAEAYLEWLNRPENLSDFTWTRIHRNPRQLPNRHTRGAHYGYMDFNDFCALKPSVFPVRRLLTGHQHVQAGWQIHDKYALNPAMTLLGLGFDERQPTHREAYTHYRSHVYMGRGRPADLPEVLALPVDRSALEALYPWIVTSPPSPTDTVSSNDVTTKEAP